MATDIRVLHVDDHAALLDLTAELLENVDDGITVVSESDPTEAMARMRTEEIDCVVSDYAMPEMDGLELCRRIRCEYPHVPFFVFTSRSGEEIVDRAFAAGATDYIQKEAGLTQYKLLAHRIENAVDHHQARKYIDEVSDAA